MLPSRYSKCLQEPHSRLDILLIVIVTTLMASGSSLLPSEAPSKSPRRSSEFSGRSALGAYITSPSDFPSAVVYATTDFVLLRDAFPKASIHLLLLPRNPQKANTHPLVAFDDATFLASAREEVRKVNKLVVAELRRLYGKYSQAEAPRIQAMEQGVEASKLPLGRDWEKDIRCGIHAGPSMHHLHIHFISVDCHSTKLKHRQHYNSFNTPFFVDMDEFPLSPKDTRRSSSHGGFLQDDLICWRCHKNFGKSMAQLILHLDEEFEEWKKL